VIAEVLGMAIGINLLFGIPLIEGVMITVLDTFLLLFLINKGIRKRGFYHSTGYGNRFLYF
jgi:manganese transport protein